MICSLIDATTYDSAGRVKDITESVSGYKQAFAYQNIGTGTEAHTITTKTETFKDTTTQTSVTNGSLFISATLAKGSSSYQALYATYDNAGKPLTEQVGSQAATLGYDEQGNLSYDSMLSAAGQTTYTYAPQDSKLTSTSYSKLNQSAAYTYSSDRTQLTSAKIGTATTNYAYNATTGDITGAGSNGYKYDSTGRLSARTGAVASYTYDTAGRRTTGAGITYSWQGQRLASTAGAVNNNAQLVSAEAESATITKSSAWYSIASSVFSGGTAMRATTASSEMSFGFVGTEVRFLGVTNPTLGSFDVYLDGATSPTKTIDCTGDGGYQSELGKIAGLNQGFHGVRIVTKSTDLVEIDRIDVLGSPASVTSWKPSTSVESDNSLITATGSWTKTAGSTFSGGSTQRVQQQGAEMTFAVTGSSVSFIGTVNAGLGSCEVYVDGAASPQATITNVSSAYALQATLGKVSFAQGTHTIRIRTTSTALVDIDRIDISGSPASLSAWTNKPNVSAESDNSLITATGSWTKTAGSTFSGGSTQRVQQQGAEMTFAVTGSSVSFIGTVNAGLGSCEVYVDGAASPQATITNVSSAYALQASLGKVNFAQGTHTIRIRTTSALLVDIDRIDVSGSPCAITSWVPTTSSTAPAQDLATSYVYDSTGQRLTKTTGTTTTSYVYDGIKLASLSAKSGSSTSSLIYLYGAASTPVGASYTAPGSSTPTNFQIVSDAHGDVRELRDTSGAAFARYDYDAYGNITSSQTFATTLITATLAQAISELQPLRYGGYLFDSETGLYYCSQRYYDPATASFISRDPAKADGEKSLYAYCGGEPVGGVDPSGTKKSSWAQMCAYSRFNFGQDWFSAAYSGGPTGFAPVDMGIDIGYVATWMLSQLKYGLHIAVQTEATKMKSGAITAKLHVSPNVPNRNPVLICYGWLKLSYTLQYYVKGKWMGQGKTESHRVVSGTYWTATKKFTNKKATKVRFYAKYAGNACVAIKYPAVTF